MNNKESQNTKWAANAVMAMLIVLLGIGFVKLCIWLIAL